MIKTGRTFRADGIAVFLLGAVFLFLSIGLVMLGASVYQNVSATAQENDEMRTTLSYIANKVRRADLEAGLEITEFQGQPALALYEDIDGFAAVTYLYCWQDSLCELFTERGFEHELGLDSGTVILPLQGLDLEQAEAGLLRVKAQFQSGRSAQMLVALKSMLDDEGGRY